MHGSLRSSDITIVQRIPIREVHKKHEQPIPSSEDFAFERSSSEEEQNYSGYGNEPYYSEKELYTDHEKKYNEEDTESSEEDENDFSRLENLHWCTCEDCYIMPTRIGCKCCSEQRSLLNNKLDGVYI